MKPLITLGHESIPMKKLIAKGLVPVALMSAQPVLADFTATFTDPCNNCSAYTSSGAPRYYGGNGNTAAGDIIGQGSANDPYESLFDILAMTVSQSGGNLEVSILTRFVQEPMVTDVQYGDLMISTIGWNPSGAAPYATDNAGNSGTTWNYVVQTSTGNVYQNATLEKSDTAPNDGLFRHDQYVRYASGGTLVGNAVPTITALFDLPNTVDGSPDAPGTQLTYNLPLALLGISAANPAEVALRWTMTCANDIIEASTVPEPTSLALLLGGMGGLRLMRRRGVSTRSNSST